MPLQTSGAISLNQIHVEAGGSSGTTASLNDSDIRALINKGSGATMSFNEWYGASASTSFTVTQGSSGSTVGFFSGSFGSISPASFDGATIRQLSVTTIAVKGGSTSYMFSVGINGTRARSFFTSVQNSGIGTLYSASSGTYNQNSGYAQWTWTLSSQPSGWDGSGNLTVVMA